MKQRQYYFSTRDLLMMAALAALGGVVGTYLSAVGSFFRSVLGFAGTMQWAAGIHVLWLTLAVGLTGKPGAGTVTGILKGAVELLTGNTHGILIVLVDVIAGLLVDIGFLPFRDKETTVAYAVAGGLASASNVFIFQLFASLPADVLAYGALVLIGGVAFLSGALFAGVLGRVLLNGLKQAGVIKDRPSVPIRGRIYPAFLILVVLLTMGLGFYLRSALAGPSAVAISGAVMAPYAYPEEHGDIVEITAESTLHSVTTRYRGIPVRELVSRAQPVPEANMLLITAADGYAFFIDMNEVHNSESLLLTRQGQGEDTTYNIVGAENSKAWVRGVSQLIVGSDAALDITGALASPYPYNPADWQFEMDSTDVALSDGPQKLQGAPLSAILPTMDPTPDAQTIVLHTNGTPVTLGLSEVLDDDEVRIFTIIDAEGIRFAVARMNGRVLAESVTYITVKK